MVLEIYSTHLGRNSISKVLLHRTSNVVGLNIEGKGGNYRGNLSITPGQYNTRRVIPVSLLLRTLELLYSKGLNGLRVELKDSASARPKLQGERPSQTTELTIDNIDNNNK